MNHVMSLQIFKYLVFHGTNKINKTCFGGSYASTGKLICEERAERNSCGGEP